MVGEPFAETLEPRGESGLLVWPVAVFTPLARVCGHA
jgi:hypothetical protein